MNTLNLRLNSVLKQIKKIHRAHSPILLELRNRDTSTDVSVHHGICMRILSHDSGRVRKTTPFQSFGPQLNPARKIRKNRSCIMYTQCNMSAIKPSYTVYIYIYVFLTLTLVSSSTTRNPSPDM